MAEEAGLDGSGVAEICGAKGPLRLHPTRVLLPFPGETSKGLEGERGVAGELRADQLERARGAGLVSAAALPAERARGPRQRRGRPGATPRGARRGREEWLDEGRTAAVDCEIQSRRHRQSDKSSEPGLPTFVARTGFGRRMARVDSIFIAPASAAPMESVETAKLIAGLGIDGDRYAVGTGTYSAKFLGEPGKHLTMVSADGVEQRGTTGVVFCPNRAWNPPKVDPVVLGRPGGL